jgi:hypothetical protein
MNKKAKRALAVGVLGMLGSKMAGAGAGSALNRPNMRNIAGEKKKSILERILNMGPGRNATSEKGGTLASKVFSKNPFGLGAMDGAKYGKMIKAKDGVYVKAKCKLGRNKPTKIT